MFSLPLVLPLVSADSLKIRTFQESYPTPSYLYCRTQQRRILTVVVTPLHHRCVFLLHLCNVHVLCPATPTPHVLRLLYILTTTIYTSPTTTIYTLSLVPLHFQLGKKRTILASACAPCYSIGLWTHKQAVIRTVSFRFISIAITLMGTWATD